MAEEQDAGNMTPASYNRKMQSELKRLLRENVLDETTCNKLLDRYPVTEWDWSSLGRWFGVFGAISLAAGIVIYAREIFEFTLVKLAWFLGILMCASFIGGYRLNNKKFTWSKRSLELLGALLLIGLTFTLGVIYSTGSGNWPALLLIDLIILLPIAYLLHNVLILILSSIVFFAWFGGFTGYSSAWGAYWFGMNYPLRFLFAAIVIIAIAIIHRFSEDTVLKNFRDFYKVWLSAGIYFAEMALWLLSLFGNFNIEDGWRYNSAGVVFLFNLFWAGGNVVLIVLGTRYLMRMLRGYGITFLIIHGYTLYFWHIAGALGFVLASAVAGGSALALVFWFEQQKKLKQDQ